MSIREEIAVALDAAIAELAQVSLDERGAALSEPPDAEDAAERAQEIRSLERKISNLRAQLAKLGDDDEEPESNDDEEPDDEEETGYNTPSIRIDGEALGYDAIPDPDVVETVRVEFDAACNGYQSEADERAPLGWVNHAAISLDRREDSVTLSISVGDPRGAFVFTVRRLPSGELLMYIPTPEDSAPHRELRPVRHGVYEIH